MATGIEGFVDQGFEGVREAFATNFSEHGDVGAGVALYVEGRKVVDLVGGTADPATGRPYGPDTLQLVFSSTKGATALCAHLLVQRGALDLDRPVAHYWPGFAEAGKAGIPVRWLLSHQAGLPTVDRRLSLEELLAWDPLVEALEVQAPLWEPGTAHGYHAVTFGTLVGEVVRRVSGRSLGRFFADEVAGPLGLEFWIGLPYAEHDRVAPLIGGLVPEPDEVDPAMREVLERFVGPDTLLGRALSVNGALGAHDFADPALWRAEMPAANGITNARSLARLYAGAVGRVVDGPSEPLLERAEIEAARERQAEGQDRVLYFDTVFGTGFMVSSPFSPYGAAGCFGHAGAGGSVGFCDPENQVGFGYVMNKMQQNLSGDPRTRGLIAAVYQALGVEAPYL